MDVKNEFEETQNLNNREGGWRSDWDTVGEGEYKGGETSGEEGTLQVRISQIFFNFTFSFFFLLFTFLYYNI